MKNTKLKYILLSVIPAMMLWGCTQEEPDVDSASEDGDYIIFHTSLPAVESRSYDNIQAGDLQGGFSVAAIAPEIPSGGNKKYTIYFDPQLVTKTEGMGDAFRGDFCRWPEYSETGMGSGKLDFCAFYPSLETMREKSGEGNNPEFFKVHDVANGDTYSYRMGNFKVNKDIFAHMDFVAAFAQGSKAENLYSGVNLTFEHKLTQVELKAWNGNKGYEIEVAGVRIGGVIVKSTYNMNGNWIHNNLIMDCVDYIYRQGDTIIKLGNTGHNTEATATSIMGKGGYAMMIPHQPSNLTSSYKGYPLIWDTTNNVFNTKIGNNTNLTVNGRNQGMYLSVLLRVIDVTDKQGLILYPYADNAVITGSIKATNANSVFLAVEKDTEKVVVRVYKDKTTNSYYTDEAKKIAYTVPDTQEVREYAWAAIPYVATWRINNKYTYVLNYSNGIGVLPPEEAAAGKTIITQFAVGVGEQQDAWVTPYEEEEIELKKNEGFTQK